MVAKISAGSNLLGALSYNGDKVKEEHAKILEVNKLPQSPDSQFDMPACLCGFESHTPNHHNVSKPVIHISLNPHPDDKLSDHQLSDIAIEYLERMGYGQQPYIVFKHEDISRHHIHIVTLGVDEQGKKINDSNNFYQSKKITRDIEQRYNLHTAEKQKNQDVYQLKKVDTEAGDVKRQVGNVVKNLAKTYRFHSLKEFRALLSLYNICMDEVKGDIKGKPYAGLVYSATNDKGEKVGNPFKSSLFGKNVGYEAIDKRAGDSVEHIKANGLTTQSRSRIIEARTQSKDRTSFETELKKRGIDVILRQNDAGRIYGVTFVDHNNHCVFNGSRLGKDLSANAINDWIANPKPIMQNASQPTEQSQQTISPKDEDTQILGGVFDLGMEQHGPDYEEEEFRRRMNRKKKKKQIKM